MTNEDAIKSTEIKEEINEELVKDSGVNKVKDITVHSMPKRYLQTSGSSKQAKGTGLLIFIAGFLVLIAALLLFYYFLTSRNNDSQISDARDNYTENTKAKPGKEPEKEKNNEFNKNVADSKDKVSQSSSSSADSIDKDSDVDIVEDNNNQDQANIEDSASSTEFLSALDTDGDGLSDIEEIIFGADINLVDTDGDGYNDLDEVLNLYDPNGSGTLLEAPSMELYLNKNFHFSFIYSTIWTIDDSIEDSIMIKLDKNQFIQMNIINFDERPVLEDWYKEQMGVNLINPEQKEKFKNGWNGIKSDDGLTVYLLHPSYNYILTVNYNIGLDDTLFYKNIFQMILNSLDQIEK